MKLYIQLFAFETFLRFRRCLMPKRFLLFKVPSAGVVRFVSVNRGKEKNRGRIFK